MNCNPDKSRNFLGYAFLIPAIGIVIYSLLLASGVIDFVNGMNPHSFIGIMLIPLVIIPIVLLILLTKALSMIPKQEKWLPPLGVVFVTILIVVGSYYLRQSSSLPKNMFQKGLQKRMQYYDSAAIRKWVKEDPIFNAPDTSYIETEKWPDTIKKMQPDVVYLRNDKSLVLVWRIMREIDDHFVICSDEEKPEWLPKHAEKLLDGFFYRGN